MKTFLEFLEAQWTQQRDSSGTWGSPATDAFSANKDQEYFANIQAQIQSPEPRQIPDSFMQKLWQQTGKKIGAGSVWAQKAWFDYLSGEYRKSGKIVAQNTQQSYGKQLAPNYTKNNPYAS